MTDQFPVEWLDPSDAEITWEWDDMHMPGALSALAGDYTWVIGAGHGVRAPADGDPGRDAGPGLERVRLLRPDDRRPRGGTGGDVGASGPSLPVRLSRTPTHTGTSGPYPR